jgi:hypothetical protein
VTYGVPAAARTFVPPPRSQDEREADRAERARTARCDLCVAIPEDVLRAVTAALHAAREGRLQL